MGLWAHSYCPVGHQLINSLVLEDYEQNINFSGKWLVTSAIICLRPPHLHLPEDCRLHAYTLNNNKAKLRV